MIHFNRLNQDRLNHHKSPPDRSPVQRVSMSPRYSQPRKHYVFFTASALPRPDAAHLVHDVHSANAAANLGYSTVLAYYNYGESAWNPIDWVAPFRPQPAPQIIRDYYQVGDRLRTVALAMPYPCDRLRGGLLGKLTSANTWACKYYFPRHIFARTGLLHTLDWNLVKAAVQAKIPVIYEREHDQHSRYDPQVVNSSYFRVAVTVADSVRQNMIDQGMPADKILKLHLGYNRAFLTRQPERAQAWRQQLLQHPRETLVVYAGALFPFKGVDLLLDVAARMPEIQFAIAGGNSEQVQAYQQQVQAKQLQNVTLLGYVQHRDLPSLLQAADVLAHPHCSGEASTFTSPLKFFDYLASGVPIAATEIPPLREFQAEPMIAQWCPPDDPIAFAALIRQTIATYPRKPDGYTHGGTLMQRYSWEHRIETILQQADRDSPVSASIGIISG
jgi:glycosyltransferase involved in cell wall biosynthesis